MFSHSIFQTDLPIADRTHGDLVDRITQEIANFSSELGRIEENPEQAMGIGEPCHGLEGGKKSSLLDKNRENVFEYGNSDEFHNAGVAGSGQVVNLFSVREPSG